jgi:UDP-N-acetylglucosamine 4,6-dehydratase/5-epimerase|tara:strand:- start:989 stop:1993 length:1005 start_codon:yes stop_codon:yes gene_type:complete
MNNKSILITGGTGSFGKKFISTVLKQYKPKRLIIYSRDEQKQFNLQKQFPEGKNSPLRYFLGDVRDYERINYALKDVDIVVHAAALKHVPIAEYNPFEVIKTNVMGAQNIIQACLNNNVKKVIALSTDKACSPINLYGATKLASDKLFVAANNYKGKLSTIFSVVRYGNVMGSRGSVIPYLQSRKESPSIGITDLNMTRFNITLDEGVKFVLKCFNIMWGGEIFIPKIPSYKIGDLAKAICSKSKIKIIGIRPGEKISEEMVSEHDSINTIESKDYFIITPNLKFRDFKIEYLKKNKNTKLCKKNFSYNSKENSKFLSVNEIKNLIKKNQKDFD